jgi:hypothetical protein
LFLFFRLLFLKLKYYRHHFVSIIIGFIGFLFIILSLLLRNNNEKLGFEEHLRHFIFSNPLGLSLVLIKYLFEHYFISPFVVLFFDGLLCLFFSFIFILLEFLFLSEFRSFVINLENILFFFEKWETLHIFIFILLYSFIYYLSSSITLYLFIPTLLVMTIILSSILIWVIDTFIYIFNDNKNDINKMQCIFKAIGYCFFHIACT